MQDAVGVSAFSTVQTSFDPLEEEIFVNDVRVTDGEGRVLSEGKVADYYTIDDTSERTANHKKILNIPVAGLQPGSRLFVAITRRTAGKLERFPFLKQSFSTGGSRRWKGASF